MAFLMISGNIRNIVSNNGTVRFAKKLPTHELINRLFLIDIRQIIGKILNSATSDNAMVIYGNM